MTQGELAKKLGVSRQAVCMWEADKRELKAKMINRIARILNTPVGELLKLQAIIGGEKEADMSKKKLKAKKIAQKTVSFELIAPQANRVVLTGNFNSWNPDAITMKKDKKGNWKTGLNLKPGRYEYKFIVDGQWWDDPANPDRATNEHGSANSVKEIRR